MTSAATDLPVTGLRRASDTSSVLKGSISRCPPEASPPCSVPPGAGRPPSSAFWPASTVPTEGPSPSEAKLSTTTEHHQPTERRHIGYVPQEGSLFPHLNVEKTWASAWPGANGRERGWASCSMPSG